MKLSSNIVAETHPTMDKTYVPCLQTLCILVCSSKSVRELVTIGLHSHVRAVRIIIRLLKRRRFTYRLQEAIEHAFASTLSLSDFKFVLGGRQAYSIHTGGWMYKTGDILAYPMTKDWIDASGNAKSGLFHFALILDVTINSMPEVIEMNGKGQILKTPWSGFIQDLDKSQEIFCIPRPGDYDTVQAREDSVKRAKKFFRRYEDDCRRPANERKWPSYNEIWWNCETFVYYIVTNGQCPISIQSVMIMMKAFEFIRTITTWLAKGTSSQSPGSSFSSH